MSTAEINEPRTHTHGPQQVCIEHSPIETILMARLGLMLRPTSLGIEMEVIDQPDGTALSRVKWIDRASSQHREREYIGQTRAQALLITIELLEQEGRRRPGVFSA